MLNQTPASNPHSHFETMTEAHVRMAHLLCGRSFTWRLYCTTAGQMLPWSFPQKLWNACCSKRRWRQQKWRWYEVLLTMLGRMNPKLSYGAHTKPGHKLFCLFGRNIESLNQINNTNLSNQDTVNWINISFANKYVLWLTVNSATLMPVCFKIPRRIMTTWVYL